ncbi:PREDICTED: uncharacterized protein LOC107337557 [Acropora digitifera]|uniref:uncharacterized protein LOC107337557 n=1 Tax=Acropora digitifera TaxID=70779 RepID=UPI00077A9AFB|nr:PREDICTED: uncharacterized protein LOC107337557 [Acropora digitifera]
MENFSLSRQNEDFYGGRAVNEMKDGLNNLILQLTSIGLSVHVLQNRAVVTERNEHRAFKVVDGEAALQFVNQPQHADKIICFNSERFYCHTEYLVLRSQYFRALFNGVYRETSMDVISIHLPAAGNVEPILHFLYSGIADGALFEPSEIFNTIQNASFLGVDELLERAAAHFATIWKILTVSPLFRGIIDSKFVNLILELGTKNDSFGDGDKLRIVVLWDEEEDQEGNFPESNRLLMEHRCLEKAKISDLEWALDKKPRLFSSLEQSAFRVVYKRAIQDSARIHEKVRVHEDKIKALSQCVRTLTRQLEEVRCNRCHLFLPRAALKSRTCIVSRHFGKYKVNQGWSCCGQLIKRSRGCKPVSLSKHCVDFSRSR